MLLKKYVNKTNTHSPKILNNYCTSIYSSLLFIWTVNSVQIEWSSQFIFVITCKIKGQHNFGCKSVCVLFAYLHIHIAVCACVCKHMRTHALKQIKLHLRCMGKKKIFFFWRWESDAIALNDHFFGFLSDKQKNRAASANSQSKPKSPFLGRVATVVLCHRRAKGKSCGCCDRWPRWQLWWLMGKCHGHPQTRHRSRMGYCPRRGSCSYLCLRMFKKPSS